MKALGAEVYYNFEWPTSGLAWALIVFISVVVMYVTSRGIVSTFDSASTKLRNPLYITAVLFIITLAAFVLNQPEHGDPHPSAPSANHP